MGRAVTAVLTGALMLTFSPVPVMAQEMEQGDLAMVMHVDVAPADRDAYRAAAEKLKAAAEAAEIEGKEWHFWGHNAGFTLYYPIADFAYFDDPMQLWREFEGTPGEELRNEFYEEMAAVPYSTKTEVVESIPSLTYWPEGYSDVGANHVHFEWLTSFANEEAWMENARGFVAFLETIGYPYGVRAFRTRIGDERMIWVFFAPSLAEFYADEAWDDLVEAAGAQDELDALTEEWEPLISHWDHSSSGYLESMSYVPDDM